MALWLVRAGKHGEFEQKFLDGKRIYVCWAGLRHDLSKLGEQRDLYELLCRVYPDFSMGKNRNYTGQIWPFAKTMTQGDWIVLPSKKQPTIHIAEITGPYTFDADAEDPYFHFRSVKWIAKDIPRSVFDQDLLYSFGAFMTICEISRNNAEQRVRALAVSDWKAAGKGRAAAIPAKDAEEAGQEESGVDLEVLARDQIAKLIIAKYKGHDLARLVDAILRAQGYTTYVSPPGADKGVDLLAAPGALGFGKPRICVQVKSGDSPLDRPTLDQLIGSMQNVQADQGLLVSWGGFKSSVDKEVPTQFFRVRLWNRDTLIGELLANYDKLDEDLRAELPLKRVWTVATQEEAN